MVVSLQDMEGLDAQDQLVTEGVAVEAILEVMELQIYGLEQMQHLILEEMAVVLTIRVQIQLMWVRIQVQVTSQSPNSKYFNTFIFILAMPILCLAKISLLRKKICVLSPINFGPKSTE